MERRKRAVRRGISYQDPDDIMYNHYLMGPTETHYGFTNDEANGYEGEYFYPDPYSYYNTYPSYTSAESAKRHSIPHIHGSGNKPEFHNIEVSRKNHVVHNNNNNNNNIDKATLGIDFTEITNNLYTMGFDGVLDGMKEATVIRNPDGTSDIEQIIKATMNTTADNYGIDSTLDPEDALRKSVLEKKAVFEVNLSKYFVDFVCGNDC